MKKSRLLGALCGCVFSFISTSSYAALIDRGGGLIYDDVLDITWLQNWSYISDQFIPFTDALVWADNFEYYDSVRDVTWDDWRPTHASPVNGLSYNYTNNVDGSTDVGFNISAPGSTYAGNTASELAFLFYNSLGNTGRYDINGNETGCLYSCWTSWGPFLEPASALYTRLPFITDGDLSLPISWGTFRMRTGEQVIGEFLGPEVPGKVMLVRDGDVVPLPAAAWLFGSGLLGLVGMARRKAS